MQKRNPNTFCYHQMYVYTVYYVYIYIYYIIINILYILYIYYNILINLHDRKAGNMETMVKTTSIPKFLLCCSIFLGVTMCVYIYMIPSSAREPPPSPPNGMGPQVAPPLPFYLQAIGSISEVQPRIC